MATRLPVIGNEMLDPNWLPNGWHHQFGTREQIGLNLSLSRLPRLDQLFLHRAPLETSHKSADNGSNSNDVRESAVKLISSNPLIKVAYLLLWGFVAVEISSRGLRYFDSNGSGKRRLYVLLAYLFAFLAICFHFAWVVVHWV